MKYLIMSLLCLIMAFSMVSCNREETVNDTPLTNESLEGKKYYTNKLVGSDGKWYQTEIRFAANNTAYLTYNVFREDGTTYTGNPQKASYNLVYPDIVFETENGYSIQANFSDNNTLVFNGYVDNIEEELICLEHNTPESWDCSRWHFVTNPQTITSQYSGQKFEGQRMDSLDNCYYNLMIIFGVNVAYINECKGDYSFYSYDYFRLVFNYPNFSEEEGWHTGYFVDANTIILIRKFGDSTYYRLTRTR